MGRNRIYCAVFIILLLASALAGCGRKGADTDFENDLKEYASVMQSLPADSYYAFADMSSEHDALLVAESVFDNLDGTLAAVEATVYGFDKDGDIKEYGPVASGGSANPLAAKDGELFCAHHRYIDKLHIDEASSKMITEESDDFEEYGAAEVIAFRPVSDKAG